MIQQLPLPDYTTRPLENQYTNVPADHLTPETAQTILHSGTGQLVVHWRKPGRQRLYIVNNGEHNIALAYLSTNHILHVATAMSLGQLNEILLQPSDIPNNALRLFMLAQPQRFNRGVGKGRVSIQTLLERHLPAIGWRGEIPK